jgi:hypothetical protein
MASTRGVGYTSPEAAIADGGGLISKTEAQPTTLQSKDKATMAARAPLAVDQHLWIRSAALLSLATMSTSCQPMPGQRLLTVQIEAHGELTFEGSQGVPDTTPVVRMWDALGDVRFEPVADESDSSDKASDKARVVDGDVVVRIKHVDDELVSVSVNTLTLRYDDVEGAWILDPAEAERVKAAAQK